MKLNISSRLKSFYSNSKHVMSVSYKPDIDTFRKTIKVVLIGTILLGVIGLIISLIIGVIA
ncbi:MAG: protein translocase SEC61 complex subunit gamma [Candidatus Micrarchaeaceae archaeon]